MLKGKTVVLGVTGSIAAYKIATLSSSLVKLHADVHVIMTENALHFINPITFETLTSNKCLVDTFDRNFQFNVEHVALAKRADVFVVAPASADVIGKLAHGIADDMLTTTIMACRQHKILFPAMNTNMFINPVVQDNLKICEKYGMGSGGAGKRISGLRRHRSGKDARAGSDPGVIIRAIGYKKDLAGKKILVTAGPTQEAIDPVRYITNHSTGKWVMPLLKQRLTAAQDVTLVSGPVALPKPRFVKTVDIISAKDMFEAVTAAAPDQDIIIKAAAVADYRPAEVFQEKVKKKDGDMAIPLTRTDDILAWLAATERKGNSSAASPWKRRICLKIPGQSFKKKYRHDRGQLSESRRAGFGTDTNVLTLITRDREEALEKMTKEEAAENC